MKKIIIVAVVVSIIAALGFLAFVKPKSIVYETKTETQQVEVDALQKQIEDAITASSTETEAKARKAYDDAKKQAELEIELAVTAQYRKDIEEKEKELMGRMVF